MATSNELLISSDSHVIEDPHLWEERLPTRLRSSAPRFPERKPGEQFQGRSGGWDPKARVEEMAVDGVSQEVLYPSLAMNLFGIADPDLQHECLRAYNDWLLEYCAVSPDRLFGIGAICTYDIAAAVKELERCKDANMAGAMVWQTPPEEISFASDHYEDFWAAAAALRVPISLHSLTGEPYPWPRPRHDPDFVSRARHVNIMQHFAADAISDLITSGVLERHPQLRFVLVESEASWIPYSLSQFDKYAARSTSDAQLTMSPSDYFARQFFVTFFNDPTLAQILQTWGTNNCMWSNDYPHNNSTWPNSRAVIERDLGGLPPADRTRLMSTNVVELYQLPGLE